MARLRAADCSSAAARACGRSARLRCLHELRWRPGAAVAPGRSRPALSDGNLHGRGTRGPTPAGRSRPILATSFSSASQSVAARLRDMPSTTMRSMCKCMELMTPSCRPTWFPPAKAVCRAWRIRCATHPAGGACRSARSRIGREKGGQQRNVANRAARDVQLRELFKIQSLLVGAAAGNTLRQMRSRLGASGNGNCTTKRSRRWKAVSSAFCIFVVRIAMPR